MGVEIRIEGLDRLRDKFRRAPGKYREAINAALWASLKTLHENVPPYPPPPENSTYIRTGTLGRSLGSEMQGGAQGAPDIFRVKAQGPNMQAAEFGTRLKYAPHVIGYRTQAPVHQGRWWTIKTLADKAAPKIGRLFDTTIKALVQWLNEN